jgi:hypothetical protein
MNEATHRELVHQFNNFLTLCMTHAEVALDSEKPEEMAEALRWIVDGSRRLAPLTRTGVQQVLPFAAAECEEVA